MISTEKLSALIAAGGNVVDSDGSNIGFIGQIYLDDQTSEPTWVTVQTGLFGNQESFAPLDSATQDGKDILVPYSKDKVRDAPRIAPDGHLEPEEEDRLYSYYGLSAGAGNTGSTTDEELPPSEEQLHGGTRKEEPRRTRLRKFVAA
ncbi:PRC-barrel domain-containing protein [Pseudarthrobacter sp. NS4]|uniref:PRC-barrel domain-containing protein n=1 Tax=Pseudarthrobacter sp. NS4 TaxID=2973976 RepID=UPI002161424D|nr:PRC-barrel domain-containing protein [Pseudarthrobacter sp. NS4]